MLIKNSLTYKMKVKSVIKRETSLIEEVELRLNHQIKRELHASMFYLSASSWCEKEDYLGSASFLLTHSDEERMHMMKIFNYINASGGHAIVPEIRNIQIEFASLKEVFELVLDHEIKVSKAINELSKYSWEVEDITTFEFMQWFLREQREEEDLARKILGLFKIIGTENQGLWMIDQEIPKLLKEVPNEV